MSILSGLSRWYKLRRHRLGIGVHSPFAYRVVRDVIYGKGIYYTVLKQRRLTRGFPKKMKRAYGIVFRLIARLAPDGVRLSNGVEPQIELLVRMADMRPIMGRGLGGYLPNKRILTICDGVDLRKNLPPGILNSGNMLIVRDLHYTPEVLTTLRNSMKGGWLFTDKRMAIIVVDDTEPLNIIDVKMT